MLQAFNARLHHCLALLKKRFLELFSFSKHDQIYICMPLFCANHTARLECRRPVFLNSKQQRK